MFVKDVRYLRVFNKEKFDKRVVCNLSEGEKQQDGTYKNYNWRTTFVGKAFDKALTLNDKDVITVISGKVTNEYVKEKEKTYCNLVVFDFELQDGASNNDGDFNTTEDDDFPF